MFILQIIFKQWDKAQRTIGHELQRANSPDSYAILFPPAVYGFNKFYVVDQHDGNLQARPIKWQSLANGKFKFDRFELDMESQVLAYFDPSKSVNAKSVLGSLHSQWVQCKYRHRYSVFEGGFYYWLYEEVILNAKFMTEFDKNVFINKQPSIIFEDINTS